MTQAGPQNLQVFSDFERVFTKFKHADGSKTLGTAELLESSGAISNEAIQQIQQINDEFEKAEVSDDDQSMFDDVSARWQAAVARHGNLHIAHLPAVTR